MSGGPIQQSGIPSTQAAILGDGWVQLGGPGGKKVYLDQLSKADQDLVIQYLLTSQFPILAPPEISGGGPTSAEGEKVALVGKVQQANSEMITAMLDGWLSNLRQTAEENKRAEEKKVLEKLDVAYQEFKSEAGRHPNQPDGNFPLFAVGMIIVGTGIHQALLPDPTMGTVEVNPVANMYAKIMPALIPDMSLQLSIVGSIFAVGVQYFTVAQVAKGSLDGGGAAPKDATFAKGYAEKMMALVGSSSFNNYLMAIVTQSVPKDKTVAPQRAAELVAMVKIILLSSSLAMLYQIEAGKMTGEEFAGMLNGTIKFDADSLKGKLVSLINGNLALLSPKDRASLLSSLLEYFDGNPSIGALAEPSKVFEGIRSTIHRGELPG